MIFLIAMFSYLIYNEKNYFGWSNFNFVCVIHFTLFYLEFGVAKLYRGLAVAA